MKKQLDGFKEEWNLDQEHLGRRSILGDQDLKNAKKFKFKSKV